MEIEPIIKTEHLRAFNALLRNEEARLRQAARDAVADLEVNGAKDWVNALRISVKDLLPPGSEVHAAAEDLWERLGREIEFRGEKWADQWLAPWVKVNVPQLFSLVCAEGPACA